MMNNWMIALIHKLRMELMRVNNGGRLMKSFEVFIITIGLALMFVRPAWAYDANSTVNFNITGKIEEPVCEVSVKPSSAIDLGTVSYQSLSGKPGASSAAKIVSIAFDNCSKGTASVTLMFSGIVFVGNDINVYMNELFLVLRTCGYSCKARWTRKTWDQVIAIPIFSLMALNMFLI